MTWVRNGGVNSTMLSIGADTATMRSDHEHARQ
jgi:hypothetical protein